MSPGEEYETYLLGVFSLDTSETKIAARYSTVADPVEGLGGPVPSLFLDQTEARKFENYFFGVRPPPPYLRVWMTVRPPPPPLISRSGSGTVASIRLLRSFGQESTINSVEVLKFCYCI